MSISISEMYCTECEKKGIDIPRKVGKEREAGHLKSLYCINCKKVTNHAEVRPFGKYNKEDLSYCLNHTELPKFKDTLDVVMFLEG